jgi:hypothetical protein
MKNRYLLQSNIDLIYNNMYILIQKHLFSFVNLYKIKYDLINSRDAISGYSTLLHLCILNRQVEFVEVYSCLL